jgi:hypothetical protein
MAARDTTMNQQADVISELRQMLSDLFKAKPAIEGYAGYARAHGYVDGYMRALLDVRVVTKAELLELVNRERERSEEMFGDATEDSSECLASGERLVAARAERDEPTAERDEPTAERDENAA